MLQPSNFLFNSRQNNSSRSSWSESNLTYGDIGLFTLNPLMMSSKQIFRLNIFINNAVRSSDYTNSLVWFNIFPHLPLSRNTNGMRMGNGAGNLSTWFINLNAGNTVLEFNNLRLGRALYFLKQVSHNLPTQSVIVFKNSSLISITGVRNVSAQVRTFW